MTTVGTDGGRVAQTGFAWQAKHALIQRLELDAMSKVEVEGLDDITTLKEDGRVISATQAKLHDPPRSLTERSEDLWKTLRIWVQIEEKGGADEYVLATTDTASASLLCLRTGPTHEEADALTKRLDEVAETSKPGQKLHAAKEAWAGLKPRSKRIGLLRRARLQDGQLKHAGLDAEIRRRVGLEGLQETTEFVAEELTVWFLGEVQARIAAKERAVFEKHEVTSKILSLARDAHENQTPPARHHRDEPPDPIDTEALFVRQLRAVGAHEPQILVAHHNLHRARLEQHRIRKLLQAKAWIEDFENELVSGWESVRAIVLDSAEDDEKAGLETLHRCMQRQAAFGTRGAATHEIQGTYHDLANHPRLGWHPRYEEVLSDGATD